MSREMRSEIIRYDVEKFKDNRKVRKFQENMQEMIRENNSNLETVDDRWKEIKDILRKV